MNVKMGNSQKCPINFIITVVESIRVEGCKAQVEIKENMT